MSFFKRIKSCRKVGKAAPRARHAPATCGTSRNHNKNMFLNYLEKSLYAQLLLAAEIEHFSCGIRPAPVCAASGHWAQPGPPAGTAAGGGPQALGEFRTQNALSPPPGGVERTIEKNLQQSYVQRDFWASRGRGARIREVCQVSLTSVRFVADPTGP